jgi:hypothetical protein
MGYRYVGRYTTKEAASLAAVEKHREWISDPGNQDGLPNLASHDLACWCTLPEPGQPDICHATVLLELANGWQT